MLNSFHNTPSLFDQELETQEIKAKSLEGLIVGLMCPGVFYDPYQIIELLKANGTPKKENSVRRALTNLCDPLRFPEPLKPPLLRGDKRLTKMSDIPNNTYRLRRNGDGDIR